MTKTSRFSLALTVLAALSIASAQAHGGGDALGKAPWGLISAQGAADLTTSEGNVLHVTVHQPAKQYYALQLSHDITAAITAGATLTYAFSARSSTGNPLHVVIERRTAPYTHYMDTVVNLTPAWKAYRFTVTIPNAQEGRMLAARLQFGQKVGQLEFKNITLK